MAKISPKCSQYTWSVGVNVEPGLMLDSRHELSFQSAPGHLVCFGHHSQMAHLVI